MSTATFHNVAKVLQDCMHNLQSLVDDHDMATISPYIDDHPQQVRAAGEARLRLIANNMQSLHKMKGLCCNSNNWRYYYY